MHARPLSGNGQIRESARETMAEPAEQVHALILCKLHSQVLQPYQNQTASSTPVLYVPLNSENFSIYLSPHFLCLVPPYFVMILIRSSILVVTGLNLIMCL